MATNTTVQYKIGLWVVTEATPAQIRTRLAGLRDIFQTDLVAFLAVTNNGRASLVDGDVWADGHKPRGDFDRETQRFSGTDYLEIVIGIKLTISHPDAWSKTQVRNGLHDFVRDELRGPIKNAALAGGGATIRKFFYTSPLGRVEEDG